MTLRSLSIPATLEKAKIASAEPWILLAKIDFDGTPEGTLLAARYPEDVVFQGETYGKSNFKLEPVTETSKGELQVARLMVSNVSRYAQSLLEQFRGGLGATVTIYVVNTAHLDGEPDLALEFVITGASADDTWATITLGAPSPLKRKFPRGQYLKNHCRHVYSTPALQASLDPRAIPCGYQGALATCDLTLDGANGCRAHDNSERFGGFPGIINITFRGSSIS
jgi:phage-related protein